MKLKFLILISILFISNFKAQTQTFVVSADTNNVLIGDLVNIRMEVTNSNKTEIQIPILNSETIEGIEVLNETELDTINKKGIFSLVKQYTVSAYDSGSYVIPRLVAYLPSESGIDSVFSDSLVLKFYSPKVDTTKSIKDIKDIISVDYTDNSLLYWIGGIVLLLAIIASLIYYFKKRSERKSKEEELDYDPNIPPYILALESLRRVENERLWQNGHFKKYYTSITDILRVYYHRIYNIKTKELTSSELVVALINQPLFDTDCKTKLEYISQYSDLSKFAKANPLPENNTQSMKFAFDLVESGKPLSDKQEGGQNV